MSDPSPQSRFDPVSFTAGKILQKRAYYTAIPHARQMAEALGVPWRVSPLRALARRLVWGDVGAGRYLQFRYDAISDALRGCSGWGVLEVAAGYSTRGIAECGEREVYVESDLPKLIAQKPALVAAIAGSARANHHFLALDVCSRPDIEAVGTVLARCRLTRPLAVVHEGLLMYLDHDEQRRARDHIRWLLATHSPQGAWITTDFSERDQRERLLPRLLNRRLVNRVERPFHRFASDDAVHQFLRAGGLRGDQLANLRAGDADPAVRNCAEHLRAWRIVLG
ncbi:MAG: class I SAM-dependent methyltransferase [Planctomycetota bacterium]